MKNIVVKGTLRKEKAIDIQCSQLAMGTGDFFQRDLGEVFNLMDDFVEAGGSLVDTAHQYIRGEEILGQWMATRNSRDQIKIMTKGAHPDDGEPGNRVTPKAIAKDLSESLERLQTDYIDLYALHRDDPTVDVGPIVEALNEHLAAGTIRAIGASNWSHQRIQAANDYAEKSGLIGFTFSSSNLSLAKSNEPKWPGCIAADQDTIEWHQETNLPLLSWSSQAGGFFSGHFTEDNPSNEEMVRVYYNAGNWKRYRRAEELAKEKGVSTIQIALAYVLNQTFQTAAIIGPEKVSELKSSIEGTQIELTKKEVEWLDLIV